ncbi:MAG: hypothetical protein R3323_01855, partial [Wenzhouxiangellaceae bacterium]|nr:hypothetical protein [Wenzhouxiangellaceae bacterium]
WQRRRSVEEARARLQWPWFIAGFVLAAALRSAWPAAEPVFDALSGLARQGMVLVLFLIGASLDPASVRSVGARALALAAVLWLLVSVVSLWLAFSLVPGG